MAEQHESMIVRPVCGRQKHPNPQGLQAQRRGARGVVAGEMATPGRGLGGSPRPGWLVTVTAASQKTRMFTWECKGVSTDFHISTPWKQWPSQGQEILLYVRGVSAEELRDEGVRFRAWGCEWS